MKPEIRMTLGTSLITVWSEPLLLPKNATPNVFVKANTDRPPITTKLKRMATLINETAKSLEDRFVNRLAYKRNSDTKPLRGGMAQIAKDSGLGRESLYKALAPGAKPRFDTVVKVARALGVKFTAQAA